MIKSSKSKLTHTHLKTPSFSRCSQGTSNSDNVQHEQVDSFDERNIGSYNVTLNDQANGTVLITLQNHQMIRPDKCAIEPMICNPKKQKFFIKNLLHGSRRCNIYSSNVLDFDQNDDFKNFAARRRLTPRAPPPSPINRIWAKRLETWLYFFWWFIRYSLFFRSQLAYWLFEISYGSWIWNIELFLRIFLFWKKNALFAGYIVYGFSNWGFTWHYSKNGVNPGALYCFEHNFLHS